MKKISYLVVAMFVALGFSACNETWDDNPRLNTHEGAPVENFLNTPVEKATSILITAENNAGQLRLTGSQPTQYGYAATVAYELQMSLSEDFETPVKEGDEIPAFVSLGTYFNLSNINPSLRSVAEGICKLLDITDAASIPTPYMKVYMRLHANVVNETNGVVPGTEFYSNVVCYDEISVGYLAIVVPGLPTGIYVRGGMNNWLNDQFTDGINLELLPMYEFLTTTESDTYELEFIEIASGVEFKIADQYWGAPNISTDGVVSVFDEWIDCVWNAGNSSFASDFKGSILIKGSDESWKVKFTKAEEDTPGVASGIYVTGGFASWGFSDDALQFYTTDVKNTWRTGVLTIPAGEFKVADSTWSNPNLGTNGEPIQIANNYTCVFGADNIYLPTEFTGTVTLRHKGSSWILLLTPVE